MRSYTDEITPPPATDSAVSVGAGFGIRLGARLIDIALSLLLGLVSGFIGGLSLAILNRLGHAPDNWTELVNERNYWGYVFGILGTLLYHGFAEGIGGTTLGKLCLGLSVVQLDGRPCGFRAAFQRSLAYLMDALFFGLVGYESMKKSARRQRYGDTWAGTMVVEKKVFTPNPKPAALRILFGIVLGAMLWSAAQIAGLFAAVYW